MTNPCQPCSTPPCPMVTSVTITETQVLIDGGQLRFHHEVLVPTASADGSYYALLTYLPIAPQNVQLTLNGLTQILGSNFTINGRTIYLGTPPSGILIGDLCWYARYQYTTDARALVNNAGVVITLAGGSPPDGYLLCVGTTVTQAMYPALFAEIGHDYAHDQDDEDTLEAAGNFRLPNTQTLVVGADGNTFSYPNAIKY